MTYLDLLVAIDEILERENISQFDEVNWKELIKQVEKDKREREED